MAFNRWLGVAKGVSEIKVFQPRNITPGSVWKMRVGTENFSFTYPASIELPNVSPADRELAVAQGLANAYSNVGGLFGGGGTSRIASLESVFFQGHYALQVVGSSDGAPVDMDVSVSDPSAARIAVTVLQTGSPQRNQKQTVRFPSTPTGGNYYLGGQFAKSYSFNVPVYNGAYVYTLESGVSTTTIGTPVSHADWRTKMETALTGQGGINFSGVSVVLNGDNTLTVTLTVHLPITIELLATNGGVPVVGYDPLVLLNVPYVTPRVAYNASAATLQTALEDYFGSGNVNVTGSYTTQFDVEFIGALAGKFVDLMPCWSDDFAGTSGYKISVTQVGGIAKHTFTIPAFGGNTNVFYKFAYEDRESYLISGAAQLADVKGALENLLGSGNVVLVRNANGTYTVDLIGTFIGASVSAITMINATNGEIASLLSATDVLDEEFTEQTIQILNRPSGGTFKLTQGGLKTSALALNASVVTINAALTSAGITNFTCLTYAGSILTFRATTSSQHVNPLGFENSLVGCNAIDVRITQAHSVAQNAKMQIAIETDPTGGTFTLTHSSNTTSALAYNISPSSLKTAIEGLASIGSGNTTVEGVNGGPYIVTFVSALAATDVPVFTGNGSLLTIVGGVAVDTISVQSPTGPNWYTNAENWSLNHVPTSSETIVFDTGNVGCLYGISDVPQIAGIDVHLSYSGAIGLRPTRDTGEIETLPTTLSLASNAAKIPIRIGLGEAGNGPSLVRIDTKLQEADVTVLFTQQPQADSLFTCMLDGGEYDLVHVSAGSVGIAIASDTVATINRLIVRPANEGRDDVTVQWGEGAVIQANEIDGGNVVGSLVPKNSIIEGGSVLYRGIGNLESIYVRNARLRYQASGGLGKYGVIASIAADGGNQAVITTAIAHGLTTGARIYVRGVVGIVGIPDGYYTVIVGSSTTMTLIGTTIAIPYGATSPSTVGSYYQANTAQWGLADAVRLGEEGTIDFSEIASPRTVVAPVLLQSLSARINDPLNTIQRLRLRNDPGYLEDTLGSRVVIMRE